MNKYIMLPAVAALGIFASCVDDKGSYDYTPINEVTVEDIDGTYYAIQHITEINIEPTFKGDIYDKNLDNYEFSWHLCRNSIGATNHNHRLLSTEPTLSWLCDEPVGTYTIYLTVKDKPSGIEKLFSTSLNVSSPYGRGIMLLGTNGEDDLAMIDMIAMPLSGDTVMTPDALINDGSITKPLKLHYTGPRMNNPTYECMWLIGEDDSWRLNSVPTEDTPEFAVLGTFTSLGLADNQYDIINEHVVDVVPSRDANGGNLSYSYRTYVTKDIVYNYASTMVSEYSSKPFNRMGNTNAYPLYKFYPKVFYNAVGLNSGYWALFNTPLFIYDTDHDLFLKAEYGTDYSTYTPKAYSTTILDRSYDPWYYDARSEERTLVYGDNTYTPGMGYMYFVMKSTVKDNDYYIYSLRAASASSLTKELFPVDLSVAKDFEKASLYSFIACRRAIFYAVGSVLHQYDFERGYHMEVDLGKEITMVKNFMYAVRNRVDDLIVATWDPSTKGEVMKFKIGDNPNKLEMEIRNDFTDVDGVEDPSKYLEKWPTRIKIVDADWRNRQ